MKPYYQDEAVTIYHGDCREILPSLPKVDLVLTDPPYVGLQGGLKLYPGGVGHHYIETQSIGDPWGANLEWLPLAWKKASLGMMVFCTYHHLPELAIALPDAKRIALITWYKRNAPPSMRNVPRHVTEYVWAFQKASGLQWGALCTHYDIPKLATGCMASERFVDKMGKALHPTQKPEELLLELLKVKPETVLDPFLGSGTTAFCAKKLGCKCIGIEIEEKYCEIAANRCRQMVMPLEFSK